MKPTIYLTTPNRYLTVLSDTKTDYEEFDCP